MKHRHLGRHVGSALLLFAVSACGTGSAGSLRSQAAPDRTPGANTSGPTDDPTFPAPWLPYLTDVNPGSGIQFATADTGWRVDGQGPAVHLDENLRAGPSADFDWPGSSVSRSTDGGRTWTTITSPDGGVWGIDLLSASTGWVVGVTSLSRTLDGGASWQSMAEPAGTHLVTVDFVSTDVGYGLTTAGHLAGTSDGGRSWTALRLAAQGVSVCFSTANDGYLSDQRGRVYASHDGGDRWQQVADSPVPPNRTDLGRPLWSQMACSGTDVWQTATVLESSSHYAKIHEPYLVRHTGDAGSTWTVVGARSEDPDIGVGGAASPVDQLGFLAPSGGSGDAVVFGVPESGWGISAATIAPNGSARAGDVTTPPHDATVPAYLGHLPDYLVVHGASFVGTTGWLYLDDARFGRPSALYTETLLYRSTDDGASWALLQHGPEHPVLRYQP